MNSTMASMNGVATSEAVNKPNRGGQYRRVAARRPERSGSRATASGGRRCRRRRDWLRPTGRVCSQPLRGCEEIPTEELPGIVEWRQGARSEAVAELPRMGLRSQSDRKRRATPATPARPGRSDGQGFFTSSQRTCSKDVCQPMQEVAAPPSIAAAVTSRERRGMDVGKRLKPGQGTPPEHPWSATPPDWMRRKVVIPQPTPSSAETRAEHSPPASKRPRSSANPAAPWWPRA